MTFNEIKVGDTLYYFQSSIAHRYFYITDKNKENVYFILFTMRLKKLFIEYWKVEESLWNSDGHFFILFTKNDQKKYELFKIIFKAHEIVDKRD